MTELHVGDIGATIRATVNENGVPMNLAGATVMLMIFKKPSGAVVTQTAVFTTDGTDGQLQFETDLVTDLDESGPWKGQVKVSIGGGTWSTSTFAFQVADVYQ